MGAVLRRSAGVRRGVRCSSYARAGLRLLPAVAARAESRLTASLLENTMGKYFLAWLLGVPGIVLLLFYLFFN